MKAIIVSLTLAVSLLILPAKTHAASEDDKFQQLAAAYIEAELSANPEEATELGDHRFDGQLTDYSAEARAKDLAAQFSTKAFTLEM
jgi:hypothetical protein